MDRVGIRRGWGQGRSAAPARSFAMLAAALAVALPVALAALLPGIGWPALVLAPALLATVAGLALRALLRDYPHLRLGACNAVTLGRAALTAGLAALLVHPQAVGWGAVAVAAFALALDGVDGWLARHQRLASAFGARFDMEVDALLALVLALLALAAGKAGPWVLALGGLRYAYVAAGVVWPWLRGDLPPRFGRKTVCVIQIATLTALLAPPVVPPLSLALAGVATAALAASFAADVLWLWRRR